MKQKSKNKDRVLENWGRGGVGTLAINTYTVNITGGITHKAKKSRKLTTKEIDKTREKSI